jgi:RsiW-degrading membrane proteinase PrsW (M82 family)
MKKMVHSGEETVVNSPMSAPVAQQVSTPLQQHNSPQIQQNIQNIPNQQITMPDGAFIASDQRWYQPAPHSPLSPASSSLRIGRYSKPWLVYRHILGVVIVAFLLTQGVVIAWLGFDEGDAWLSLVGALCMLPFVGLLLAITRPRLAHVRIAVASPNGSYFHTIQNSETIQTPGPTTFAQHIIRDDSTLDTPPSRTVWLAFTALMIISVTIALALVSGIAAPVILTLAVLIGIPAWLFGFSIPVLAWWSYSSEALGLDTKRRDAEAWLIAGMLSAIPAIIINSFLAPGLIPASLSAPIGEELCKGLAAALFIGRMRGRKHGFQIGFTVGLGFAMIENLQYILFSFGSGYVGFTFTALIRGLGSIPGHAFWTGLTGFALGAIATKLPAKIPILDPHGESAKPSVPWLLVDPETGERISNVEPISTLKSDQNNLAEVARHGLTAISDTTMPTIPEITMPIAPEVPLIEMAQLIDGEVQMIVFEQQNIPRMIKTRNGLSLMPTSNLAQGLGLAMLGHATWNASSILVPWLVSAAGVGEIGVILSSLIWIGCLVAGVIWLGRGVLTAVSSLEDETNVTESTV